ncbi:hypothetical protein GQ57_39170 [Burkholderia sp. MSh2]|nr:hypothetical protein GQ57_39170 [Burkholderia sp. MSh2]KFG92232.1 hypothetical protein GQ56_0138620 [Burkholderia paludis]
MIECQFLILEKSRRESHSTTLIWLPHITPDNQSSSRNTLDSKTLTFFFVEYNLSGATTLNYPHLLRIAMIRYAIQEIIILRV